MQAGATTDIATIPLPARPLPLRRTARLSLALLSLLALGAGGLVLAAGGPAIDDPGFLRLMRFMAAIKGVFALAALAACLWRLARPAGSWRTAVYVAGPPLMIVGACGLWTLRDPGLSALGLHLGLFAVLAAALTDRAFIPDSLLGRRLVGRR